jgi:uncharacterized protein (TIGR03084 family)
MSGTGVSSRERLTGLLADLDAERAELRALVAELDPPRWRTATPSPGWCVRDQVAHLAFFDGVAALAVAAPERFRAEERAPALADIAGYERNHLGRSPAEGAVLLAAWAGAATRFRDTAERASPGSRVPWFGPAMSLASMVTARLMETWAHGHDVTEALGARRLPTDRLRHVASLAVRARAYGYIVRGLEPPAVPVRVELDAPSGEQWTFGPADAPAQVRGPAEDFCLVLTRRRHPADTALVAVGDAAREWLSIGQAYAGPPGPGPSRRMP